MVSFRSSKDEKKRRKIIGTVPIFFRIIRGLMMLLAVQIIIGTVPIFGEGRNYEKFLQFRNNGQHQEALQEIEKLIISEPGNYDYLFHQGLVLSWLGRYNRAEKIFLTIINKYPDYYEVYLALARIYRWQSEYNKAENILNELLSLKNDNAEAIKLLKIIGNDKQQAYSSQSFIDNILSLRKDDRQTRALSRQRMQSIELFSTYNVLRDYIPELKRYPYKEINFRAGAGYNTFHNDIPLSFYYTTGYIKEVNTKWKDNEYFLALNSLTFKTNFEFKKTNISCAINTNHYNNYSMAYYKTSANTIRFRPFILIGRNIIDNYRLYFAYNIDDWFRKSKISRNLYIENLHTIALSNLFIHNEVYYSGGILQTFHANESDRNYTEYNINADKSIYKNNNSEVRMNLQYKFRDYMNTNVNMYNLKTVYTSNFYFDKIEYKASYELSVISPYTTIGHKFELDTKYNFNERISLNNNIEYFFQSTKDKDREFNIKLNIARKY
jgi:tetratricopeptide (TPR) repeat protein